MWRHLDLTSSSEDVTHTHNEQIKKVAIRLEYNMA